MQVDRIKPTLKSTGTERLTVKCDILPSTSAIKFNMRRYSTADYVTYSCRVPGAGGR